MTLKKAVKKSPHPALVKRLKAQHERLHKKKRGRF